MAKSRSHAITIRARFNAPLTSREARYAVWNAIQGYELYGDGKQTKRQEECDGRNMEPYDTGKITVRR
jgi:hypothetical protein